MQFFDIKPFIRYARIMKVTADTVYPYYRPYDSRLFYVKEGEGEIELNGQTIHMTKGSVVIISAGYEYLVKAPENFITYIAFNFDFTQNAASHQTPVIPADSKSFKSENILDRTFFEDEDIFNSFVFVKNIESIEKTLEKLLKEYTNRLIGYRLKSSSLMTEALIEVLRKTKLSALPRPDITEKVLNYIHTNYMLPITNKSIAQGFGFHPNYLSELIKKNTGMPMHKYILEVRLLHAIELLETHSFTISEIAEACGFCDIYYFSRYFKSVMKITPTEFLRNSYI